MVINNKWAGIKAEDYFSKKLHENNINHKFVDDWYDFEVGSQKVEVKSCRISIKGKYRNKDRTCRKCLYRYQIGRFDFTNKESREKQFDENIWIAFLVRHREQFMVLGMIQARELKKLRYISLHKMRDLKCLQFESWIKKLTRDLNAKKNI